MSAVPIPLYMAFLIMSILASGCAKQGFPPGGPLDDVPPEVISTWPRPNSVSVDVTSPIWVEFSEVMDRRSTEPSIFISPNPSGELRIKWGRRKAKLKLPGGLRDGTTYVVTIGANASDLHGNRLGSSYSFAFSTGDSINTGRIKGRVIDNLSGASGAQVWAYVVSDGRAAPDPSSGVPDYVTQSDGSGYYGFSYLSHAEYRLLSFRDRDRNGVYTPGRDPIGVCSGDVSLGAGRDSVTLSDIVLAIRDTTPPSLVEVKPTDGSHLSLRFNERLDIGTLRARISDGESLKVVSIYGDPLDLRRAFILTGIQTPDRRYSLDLLGGEDLSGNALSPVSLTFFGSPEPDTTAPRVVLTIPPDSAATVMPRARIEVAFSEAMEMTDPEGVYTISPPHPLKAYWVGPNRLAFEPEGEFKRGTWFRLTIGGGKLSDPAGNRMEESFSLSFRTASPEELGTVSGAVTGSGGPFIIELSGIPRGKGAFRTEIPSPGPYSVEVPKGDYLVSAFEDRDGDGTFNYGSPHPFSPSERFVLYPDTVHVRARWESSGIDLNFR